MKKHVLLIPILSLAFIGCETQAHKGSVKIESTDHAAIERDKLQTQMVKKAIETNPLLEQGRGLEVEVKNGTATIRGTVTSPEAKEALSRAVKSVQGIKQVNSEVKIERK